MRNPASNVSIWTVHPPCGLFGPVLAVDLFTDQPRPLQRVKPGCFAC